MPRKLLRGQKLLDGITGEEIYQRASTTRFQRDMYMHKDNYDDLTTDEMEDMLLLAVDSQTMTFQGGQGTESPDYSNLPKFADDAAAIAYGLLLGMPYLTLDGVLTHVGIPNINGNVMLEEDGSPMLDEDGSYMLEEN